MLVSTRHGQVELDRLGQGRPVLLLHGIPGSRRSWAPTLAMLAASADVVVPDLLGFGGSDRPTALRVLHALGQAEATLDALDALGVGRAVVIGHDFGGPVALRLLELAPDRVAGLGLISTNAFRDTPIPAPLNTITWPVVGAVASRVLMSDLSLRMMLRSGTGPGAPPLDVSTHLGDPAQRRSIRTIFTASLRHLDELYEPVEAVLESATVPGFVAWGDRDPFFSVAQGRRTAAAFAAPFHLIEGAGHFLPAERPDEVAALVCELLGRTARTGERQEPSA